MNLSSVTDNPPRSGAISLSGTVKEVLMHVPETGFSLLRVSLTEEKTITVRGITPSVATGEWLNAVGAWRETSYGPTFYAQELRLSRPSTPNAIVLFLASTVKGFGPARGRRLVDEFGDRLAEMLEHNPEQLDGIKGLTPAMRRDIVSAWNTKPKSREVELFLLEHDIPASHAVRLSKAYGEAAISVVRSDPYRLVRDIRGIGFQKADAIARKIGMALDSPERIRAGIRYTLEQAAQEGHCAVTRDSLITNAAKLLQLPVPLIGPGVTAAANANDVTLEVIGDDTYVYLPLLHRAEALLANEINRLLVGSCPWGTLDIAHTISVVEQEIGMQLSPSQRHAVEIALQSKVMVITGGPGVGKSSLMRCLLHIFEKANLVVGLCAPTGRAAKRLSETTGRSARTIHRLLEFDPRTRRFTRDQERPLDVDVLIVDEPSMVGIRLMRALLAALPDRAAVVFAGDPDQLPSIEPGAVLSEFLASRRVPRARLTEIFRQAAESEIILAAHAINEGLIPGEGPRGDFEWRVIEDPADIEREVIELVSKELPSQFGFDPLRDIAVVVPMHNGRLGTKSLNRRLQEVLQEPNKPFVSRNDWQYVVGDKVLQLSNDYLRDVMNGDSGHVVRVEPSEGRVHVDFDGRIVTYSRADLADLAPGHVQTGHKSQGSEYPCVVIPIAMEQFVLLDRRLLYTAVTRGRRRVVIVGQRRALRAAIENQRALRRVTHLARRIDATI